MQTVGRGDEDGIHHTRVQHGLIVLKCFGRQAILRLKSVHGHIASAAKCRQLHIFNTPRNNESNIVSRYRADPGDA